MINKRGFFQNIVLALTLGMVLLFCVFPFIQILSTSLKYQPDWGNPSLVPQKINLEAYKDILGLMDRKVQIPDQIGRLLDNSMLTEGQKQEILAKYSDTNPFPFLRYMLNSFLLSISAATISLLLSVFGAYALSRLRFMGRNMVQRSVLFVYMIGGVLLMVPLYQMSVRLGLAKSVWGSMVSLLLIYIVQTLPVSLYMLGNYFRTIPYSFEEAAMADGCSRIQSIFYIVLPLSVPMLVTVFVYCFVIAWNEFLFASVFLRQYHDFHTLPLALQSLFVSKNAIWDRIMSASMLTLTPVILCFMFALRNLTGGFTEGGVKE
ncbi:MAG: carbohydrate ABC transporter permease [Deltaproteobacteria bacterium]|nr:carbohydrate ABC transporter permease [Deltaproteobacteria bacterium]MBW1913368.1 carbohydrate ABC transporter permease [Deltaproteobacteria bacterium]